MARVSVERVLNMGRLSGGLMAGLLAVACAQRTRYIHDGPEGGGASGAENGTSSNSGGTSTGGRGWNATATGGAEDRTAPAAKPSGGLGGELEPTATGGSRAAEGTGGRENGETGGSQLQGDTLPGGSENDGGSDGSKDEGGTRAGGAGGNSGTDTGGTNGNEGYSGDTRTGGAPAGGNAGAATGGTAETGGAQCSFVSAEVCFNGIDDDCDGAVDAADSACAATAVCIPAPGTFAIGVFGPAGEDCPTPYDADAVQLGSGLQDNDNCVGCNCSAILTCEADIYTYESTDACWDDTDFDGGTYRTTIEMDSAGLLPNCYIESNFITGTEAARVGFRASEYRATNGPCVASGTATLVDASWNKQARFCTTDLVGGGCDPGYVSVPADDHVCVLAQGDQDCPPGYYPEGDDWFTGFEDTRSCGACACGAQTAGDCSTTSNDRDITVQLYWGVPGSCGAGIHRSAGEGDKNCDVMGACEAIGFSSSSPKTPTCPPVAEVTGSLTPTGRYTICCP